MEYIKKTILRLTTTGTTTGCTGTCRVIIPVTDANSGYTMMISLVQEATDIGFFDAYNFTGVTGTTIIPISYIVTGISQSRLTELRKYTITPVFQNQYFGNGTSTNDGVDYNVSTTGKTIYFIGGIRYVDILTGFTTGTTFSFIGQGYGSSDFINLPIYKDMNKENIISNPKIANDVFIVRQELSAFDGNYRLEYIKSLVDLESYAGGGFFNIVNNT
jgi:hypothetical protein